MVSACARRPSVPTCLETSFRWRHRFLEAARDKRPSAVTGIVEADETLSCKSAKGSTQAGRPRAQKARRQAEKARDLSDDYDIVLIVRDRTGATTDTILPDCRATTFRPRWNRSSTRGSVLVTDGRHAYGAFAHDSAACCTSPSSRRQGEHVYEGFHIQNVNAYASRLKNWMAPLQGRRLEVPDELSRLAPHDRARRQTAHAPGTARQGDGVKGSATFQQNRAAILPVSRSGSADTPAGNSDCNCCSAQSFQGSAPCRHQSPPPCALLCDRSRCRRSPHHHRQRAPCFQQRCDETCGGIIVRVIFAET